MKVRRATGSDMPGVIRLLDRSKLPTSDLADPSDMQFWVADRDGVVIGAVALECRSDAALLRSLVVDPAERGTGLGVALVATAESAAHTQGITRIALLTETAREFFQRRGYAVIPREQAPDALKSSAEFRSLCPASAVCMSKSLDSTVFGYADG
jgi:N-acetylglutamate synthase-like GNAT family acetyltransferase